MPAYMRSTVAMQMLFGIPVNNPSYDLAYLVAVQGLSRLALHSTSHQQHACNNQLLTSSVPRSRLAFQLVPKQASLAVLEADHIQWI
jgi:hypothetical protein